MLNRFGVQCIVQALNFRTHQAFDAAVHWACYNSRRDQPWNSNHRPIRKSTTNKKGVMTMPKFMSSHSVPAGAMKREQVDQLAQAAQNDATVRPYRSFLNLAEGKVFCVMESPNKEALAAWFKKMSMPCDYITQVELEGEQGTVKNA